jgi:hypothetical protein
MDPSSDLTNALQVLGLTCIPRTSKDLARSVAARHPASKAWSSQQSAAYRTVWQALEPAGASAGRRAVVTWRTRAA